MYIDVVGRGKIAQAAGRRDNGGEWSKGTWRLVADMREEAGASALAQSSKSCLKLFSLNLPIVGR